MAVRQYIGARYVPRFSEVNNGIWSNIYSYEPLIIVKNGNDYYTSKKSVPVGIAITNTEYWIKTGDYNGAISEINNRLSGIDETLTIIEKNFTKRIHVTTLDGIVFNDNSSDAKASNTLILQQALNDAGPGSIIDFNNGDDICYFNRIDIVKGQDNITITGGTISGTFRVKGDGQSRNQVVHNVHFNNCNFLFDSNDTTTNAIEMQFAFFMNVVNCKFTYGGCGIYVMDSHATGGSPECRFRNNVFEYCNYAILAEEAHVSGAYNKSMSDPEISGNIFRECKTAGIRLEETDGATLEGNTFYNCHKALYLSECPFVKIVGNTLFEASDYSMYLYHCSTGIISNNQIQGSGASDSSNQYASIILEGYGQFAGGKTVFTISDNIISHNRNDAIKLKSAHYITIKNNIYWPEESYTQSFLNLTGSSQVACRNNEVVMDPIDYTTHKFVEGGTNSYLWSARTGNQGIQRYNAVITGNGTTGWHTATVNFDKKFFTIPTVTVSNTSNQGREVLSVYSVSTTQAVVGYYGNLGNGVNIYALVEARGIS